METILPDDTITKSSYDLNNNQNVSMNQVGDETTRIYDPEDRLFQEIDPEGNKTTYL